MEGFYRQYGTWAVVTGDSCGIGEEFSRQLAALSFNPVMIARRQDRLERLALELISSHAVQVKTIVVDLSRGDFLRKITAQTDSLDFGLLVNNAGFARTGNFPDHILEEALPLLLVNWRAAMLLAIISAAGSCKKSRVD